jgi:dihydrofolate reductase
MRKVCLFIAMSLDGYIAKPNDDLSFLKLVEKEGEDYGYAAFTDSTDTLIIGRKTYEYVVRTLGSSFYDTGQRDVCVMTRRHLPSKGRVIFYSQPIEHLIQTLQSEKGKHIYCDGGAEVIHSLLNQDLVDEMTLSIVPVFLGEGVRLFKEG